MQKGCLFIFKHNIYGVTYLILMEETMLPGIHETEFNASQLKAVYLAVLQTNET